MHITYILFCYNFGLNWILLRVIITIKKSVQRTVTSVKGDSEAMSFFSSSSHLFSLGRSLDKKLTGSGKMIVEFFSAEMVVRVWRYRSWRAEGDSEMISAASFSAREAFISPSAAMTYKWWWSFDTEHKTTKVQPKTKMKYYVYNNMDCLPTTQSLGL